MDILFKGLILLLNNLHIYIAYCPMYSKILTYLESFNAGLFGDQIRSHHASKKGQGHVNELKMLLLIPIQRLTRYPLLYRSIKKAIHDLPKNLSFILELFEPKKKYYDLIRTLKIGDPNILHGSRMEVTYHYYLDVANEHTEDVLKTVNERIEHQEQRNELEDVIFRLVCPSLPGYSPFGEYFTEFISYTKKLQTDQNSKKCEGEFFLPIDSGLNGERRLLKAIPCKFADFKFEEVTIYLCDDIFFLGYDMNIIEASDRNKHFEKLCNRPVDLYYNTIRRRRTLLSQLRPMRSNPNTDFDPPIILITRPFRYDEVYGQLNNSDNNEIQIILLQSKTIYLLKSEEKQIAQIHQILKKGRKQCHGITKVGLSLQTSNPIFNTCIKSNGQLRNEERWIFKIDICYDFAIRWETYCKYLLIIIQGRVYNVRLKTIKEGHNIYRYYGENLIYVTKLDPRISIQFRIYYKSAFRWPRCYPVIGYLNPDSNEKTCELYIGDDELCYINEEYRGVYQSYISSYRAIDGNIKRDHQISKTHTNLELLYDIKMSKVIGTLYLERQP